MDKECDKNVIKIMKSNRLRGINDSFYDVIWFIFRTFSIKILFKSMSFYS